MSTRVEVLVVGGGPAGALLAHGLAAQGRHVVLVEAQATARPKPCGEFLAPAGVAVLRRWGLLSRVRPFAQELRRLSLSAGSATMQAQLPSLAMGIRREDLDHTILAAAEPRADVWRGRRVLGIERLADGVAAWRAHLEGHGSIDAVLLIGADGRHSRIRQGVGLGPAMERTGRHALVVRARGVVVEDGGEMHLGAWGQIGICPLPAQHGGPPEVNLNLLLAPAGAAQLATLPGHELMRAGIALTPSLAGRLSQVELVGRTHCVAHLRQVPSRVSAHQVALIGDAALCCDPFTGEGISNALLDAEHLLRCLASWSSAANLDRALRAYDRSHRRLHARQRWETRVLPLLLDQAWLAPVLVEGLHWLGLSQQLIGDRHRDVTLVTERVMN